MARLSLALCRANAVIGCVAASAALAQAPPPAAPVKNVVDTYFGVAVADPYRYLENLKDPDVLAWLNAQAAYTRGVLDRIPQRRALLERITELGDAATARVSSVQINGDHVYYLKRRADENIPKLYVRQGLGGEEKLLLDPEAIKAPNGDHYAIDYFQPSLDNRYVACGISPGGSEDSVLHVLEVATAKETGDAIDRTAFASPAWLPDGRLVYGRLPKLPPDAPPSDKFLRQRVYVHTLGTSADDDRAVFGFDVLSAVPTDPAESYSLSIVAGSPFAVAAIANGVQREMRLYVARVRALEEGQASWIKVADTDDAVTDFALIGETLFLLSHKDAPRFKVLRVALGGPGPGKARVAVPQRRAVIRGLAAAKDALYVRRMDAGISELLRLGYRAHAKPKPVKLPFAGDIDALAADPRLPGVVFEAGSWTRFGGYYAFDARLARVVDTGLQPQGRYDHPADLVSREVKVKSADGTLVPLSIVHKKGLRQDGGNPTILQGYGAYGYALTPFYLPQYLAWLERGGVLAFAHVRGGGEYGDDWHRAGQKLNKPNTWKDAIACAEWLIANRYTSAARLAIEGGSAGGLLVGGAITERPDLFAAALDEVPFSDALRSETGMTGPGNVPEFGTVTTEEGFRSLLQMSAYHRVKDGVKYPAVLVTTGINDPRVDAWDPAKMAARLQAASASGKPVLLRVEFDAGHGIGSTKKQRYEELADIFAFTLWQLGVNGFQP